jgi:hypothetical protein
VQGWSAQFAQALLLGLALGYARHRSGSLLAPMLLHIGVNGTGIAAMAATAVVAIPGYNAPGAHTPLVILVPALASVALGTWMLSKESAPGIPVVPVLDESDPFED